MRQKLILYEMNYHVPYCMRCTCQAQRDAHLEQHEIYISCVQSLLFQERSKEVQAEKDTVERQRENKGR